MPHQPQCSLPPPPFLASHQCAPASASSRPHRFGWRLQRQCPAGPPPLGWSRPAVPAPAVWTCTCSCKSAETHRQAALLVRAPLWRPAAQLEALLRIPCGFISAAHHCHSSTSTFTCSSAACSGRRAAATTRVSGRAASCLHSSRPMPRDAPVIRYVFADMAPVNCSSAVTCRKLAGVRRAGVSWADVSWAAAARRRGGRRQGAAETGSGCSNEQWDPHRDCCSGRRLATSSVCSSRRMTEVS